MPSVTIDRIDALRRHIADAVVQTTNRSTLPEQQQKMILAQACRESCDLLSDWLDGLPPEPGGAASDVPVREFLRDQQAFTEFLSPLFADALRRARASRSAARAGAEPDDLVQAAHREVASAVRAASATARRQPRLTARQLFSITANNVGELRREVCQLAGNLGAAGESEARQAVRKRRALKALKVVGNVLLSLSVSLATPALGPQVNHEMSALAHGAQIVIAHELAARAQPGVTISPSRTGPHLR